MDNENKADIVVSVISGCSLIDNEVTEKIVQHYIDRKNKCDYVSNTIERTHSIGLILKYLVL